MVKYQTTKADCQKAIDERGKVCPGCGRRIIPLKTVDNSGRPTYWPGCVHCDRFTCGTEKKNFEIAKNLFTEKGWFRPAPIDAPDASSSKGYIEYYNSVQLMEIVDMVEMVFEGEKKIAEKSSK